MEITVVNAEQQLAQILYEDGIDFASRTRPKRSKKQWEANKKDLRSKVLAELEVAYADMKKNDPFLLEMENMINSYTDGLLDEWEVWSTFPTVTKNIGERNLQSYSPNGNEGSEHFEKVGSASKITQNLKMRINNAVSNVTEALANLLKDPKLPKKDRRLQRKYQELAMTLKKFRRDLKDQTPAYLMFIKDELDMLNRKYKNLTI